MVAGFGLLLRGQSVAACTVESIPPQRFTSPSTAIMWKKNKKKKEKKSSDADVSNCHRNIRHLLENDASLTDGELIGAVSEHRQSFYMFFFFKFPLQINK